MAIPECVCGVCVSGGIEKKKKKRSRKKSSRVREWWDVEFECLCAPECLPPFVFRAYLRPAVPCGQQFTLSELIGANVEPTTARTIKAARFKQLCMPKVENVGQCTAQRPNLPLLKRLPNARILSFCFNLDNVTFLPNPILLT